MEVSPFCIFLKKRNITGSFYNNKLRKESKIPAVIYNNKTSYPVYISQKDSELILKSISSGLKILNVSFDNRSLKAIVKNIQYDHSNQKILHLDLQEVNMEDKIKLHVFFNFINAKKSIGIKKGGFLIKRLNSVEIKCKVKYMPKYIDLDLINLDINKSIFLKNIKFPKNVSVPLLNKLYNFKLPIVSIIGSKTEDVKSEVK